VRQVIACLQRETGLGHIGSASIGSVINAIRCVCVINYDIIRCALENVWAFSIAIDGGTKSSVPYLDCRVRFVLGGELFNVHLFALPMYESHTGESCFNLVSSLLPCVQIGRRSLSVFQQMELQICTADIKVLSRVWIKCLSKDLSNMVRCPSTGFGDTRNFPPVDE